MKKRRRFLPASPECLEGRAVMSAYASVAPVPVSPAAVTRRSSADLATAAAAQANQAFDAFTRDYLQAQAAYLATGSAEKSFRSYVRQRVQLLSLDLTRTLSHVPGSFEKLSTQSPGRSVVLQAFLRNRITGNSLNSLYGNLTNVQGGAVPPAGSTATTATLYTYQALSAIETARASTINGVSLLVKHQFQNGKM